MYFQTEEVLRSFHELFRTQDELDQRIRQLEEYLRAVLGLEVYRDHPETVSAFGFNESFESTSRGFFHLLHSWPFSK